MDFEVHLGDPGELSPDRVALIDQRQAELNQVVDRLIAMHLAMLAAAHHEDRPEQVRCVEALGELMLGLSQSMALSVIATLSGRMAQEIVENYGGIEKLLASMDRVADGKPCPCGNCDPTAEQALFNQLKGLDSDG